jgi:hypothetical protein
MAVRSARIRASGMIRPCVGSAKRLYETLGNFQSTEGAMVCGLLSAQNSRCMHATRQTTAAKLPIEIARRWGFAEPIHLPAGVTLSANFIMISTLPEGPKRHFNRRLLQAGLLRRRPS